METLFFVRNSFSFARSYAVSSKDVIRSFLAPNEINSLRTASSLAISAALCNGLIPSLSCALISVPNAATLLIKFKFSLATAKCKRELLFFCKSVTFKPLSCNKVNFSSKL